MALTIRRRNGESKVFNVMKPPSSSATRSLQSSIRPFEIQTRPWEPGDPELPFRKPLHPWDGGIAPDRFGRGTKRSYAAANADATVPGRLLFPPKLTPISLSGAGSDVPGTRAIWFDSKFFIMAGRRMMVLSTALAPTVDKDFTAGKAAVTMAAFAGRLTVGMGETEKLYTRDLTSKATSGTANAAVTTTNTTLTDTRLALVTDAYIGATVSCNGKTLVVTSNTATTFTGTAWSGGGNPGNGFAWTVAGGWWTQSADAYALCLGVSGKFLWRVESDYLISNTLSDPRVAANWAPSSAANKYRAGDGTYTAQDNIADFQGSPWIFKDDGAYAPDNQTVFYNQVPQVARVPDSAAGYGWWIGDRSLWFPTDSALYRLRQSESKPVGPELSGRPDYRFRVRAGMEHAGHQFVVVEDQAGSGSSAIYRMVPDQYGLSPNGSPYLYHEWVRLPGTGQARFIGIYPNADSCPQLIVGYGNDAYAIALGRGGGRMVDDSTYQFGTTMEIESGGIPFADDLAIKGTAVGVQVLCTLPATTGAALTVSGAINDGDYKTLLSAQDQGGIASIGPTDGFEKHTRYFSPDTPVGNYARVKISGTLNSASGTTRPEILEAWLFGWLRPELTDVLQVTLVADGDTLNPFGLPQGDTAESIHRFLRKLMRDKEVVELEFESYENFRTTNWYVSGVDLTDQGVDQAPDGTTSAQRIVRVSFARVDFANAFAADDPDA